MAEHRAAAVLVSAPALVPAAALVSAAALVPAAALVSAAALVWAAVSVIRCAECRLLVIRCAGVLFGCLPTAARYT